MAAPIAAFLLPGLAAADDPAGVPIARVDVVGIAPLFGLGIERELLPYPVQVAGDKTIRKEGGENLGGFMTRQLVGVNANEVSGSPFQNDITFHGYRASPVLGSAQGISVYLDGVRVNEAFGDVINWDMLPETAVASLVLVPGANPLFGLNTLGGALAFTTKSGQSHPGGDAELSFSSRGQRRADLAYGWQGQDGWHGFAGSTLFDGQGWRQHSAGHLANLFLKLGRSKGDTDWSATLLGGRSRLLGNGLLPDPLYADERRAVYTYPDTTRNRLLQGSFMLTQRFSAGSELNAVAYVRNSRRDTVNGDVSEVYADYVEECAEGYDGDGQPRSPGCGLTREQGAALHSGVLNTTRTRQHGRGASLAFSSRRGDSRFEAGASIDHSSVSYAQTEQEAFVSPARKVEGDPDEAPEPSSSVSGTSRIAGVYLAASVALAPNTQLTASARYNHARVSNTLTADEEVQPTERFTYRCLNPALGLTHRFGPRATVFANAAQSNRIPTVIELGCADPERPCRLPVGLQSDPYLKQVLARTVEAGVRGTLPQSFNYALSLHRTVNRDDILFLSAPSRQGYFANFERTRHQGLDLSLSGSAGAFNLRFAYSWLQAVYDADATLFTGARNVAIRRGTPIAGLPRHTAKLGLDWTPVSRWSLGADLQVVSPLVTQGNEDGLVEDATPGEDARRADLRIAGHALLSLRASYRPSAQWEWFARVSNLFDRRYESFGALGPDLFPHGHMIKPHEEAGQAGMARFVAPGAPRTLVAGLRTSF